MKEKKQSITHFFEEKKESKKVFWKLLFFVFFFSKHIFLINRCKQDIVSIPLKRGMHKTTKGSLKNKMKKTKRTKIVLISKKKSHYLSF